MNSKRILRTSRSVTAHVFVFARYGAPINRWKHVYKFLLKYSIMQTMTVFLMRILPL